MDTGHKFQQVYIFVWFAGMLTWIHDTPRLVLGVQQVVQSAGNVSMDTKQASGPWL